MSDDKLLVLSGKTGYGKHRIREHGVAWLVLKDQPKPVIDRTVVRSIRTGDERWIMLNDDPHFNVVSTTWKE